MKNWEKQLYYKIKQDLRKQKDNRKLNELFRNDDIAENSFVTKKILK